MENEKKLLIKSFQPATEEDNTLYMKEGLRVYEDLRERYPNQDVEDLDKIFNSLCAALVMLALRNVKYDNYLIFLQLMYKSCSNNLMRKSNENN